ncbi:hypothetical protein [Lysobacter antibioticus]|uniref:Transmembrane protein n=1 Tax=Lysobacter antibioticus TaxID=84531 RepID=A0A0S2F7F2_LYSAN|nr:hypothetical protein [Lysobacter antibioticus]ALN79471.1 hypothetical protein LA76x_1314 [Lysobacter antibioticus]
MTAQIEPNPREGRELSLPMTWRDWLAYFLAHALMAGLAFALWFPHPYVLSGLAGFAGLITVLAFVLSACRHE